jgi:hypothetical protein
MMAMRGSHPEGVMSTTTAQRQAREVVREQITGSIRAKKRPPPSLHPRPRAISPAHRTPAGARRHSSNTSRLRRSACTRTPIARMHDGTSCASRVATAIDTPPSLSATMSSEITNSTLTNRSVSGERQRAGRLLR